MKRDRRAVRDERRMISVNQYDVDRINKLLEQTGVEEARLIYRAFKRGLDELEIKICEARTRKNHGGRSSDSTRPGEPLRTPAVP